MEQDTYNYDKVARAISYIVSNAREQPTLFDVADEVNTSQFHLQRVFSDWAGISPKKFLQYITASYLKEKIRESQNLAELAEQAGLSSQSRVYDHFVSIEAVTPHEFRSGGQALEISYGFHPTPFGECFIAVTSRGICAMAFVDEATRDHQLVLLEKKWHNALIVPDAERTRPFINQIFSPEKATHKLPLLVQGTNFQLKVWEALLTIPPGAVTTYQHIARSIGSPGAVRAVGTAVGDNPVAFIIPCHRVIRKEGVLGEYRWGSVRKKALIGWEASRIAGDTLVEDII
ncbi:methylated-DNA--[protein]-cysteine S-methyltransferase [Dyadobacter sandarakinus]|uniref:Methylated-DNA--[protein]-cysteine S-methyltransferase n=1 Tax=Dyadobacter sandarakinus TaxID=2747268 RepID=A0ABX7I4T6_9BACT|nr:methylated-DNA--[protein]-cysteine S-methyltransferase [Dyadobacter sandarakinus]QRR00878.1 methylated-DNA--[protein]-cysteine S-methyltransferase [Dyadobacter sandarakinus]